MAPERTVHYADSGGLQIAYEVIGDGPLDIVMAFDTGGNIDLMHDHPEVDRFLRRFGEYGRLIHLDLRGAGLSDPIEHLPTLEEWADDIRAVLADVGIRERGFRRSWLRCPAVHALRRDAPQPDRGPGDHQRVARMRRDDDYPWGMPSSNEAAMFEIIADSWGAELVLGWTTPGCGSEVR